MVNQWSDWAIYCTLVNFSKPVERIILSKSLAFLAILVKVSKSFIFLVQSFWTFTDHTVPTFHIVQYRNLNTKQLHANSLLWTWVVCVGELVEERERERERERVRPTWVSEMVIGMVFDGQGREEEF